MLDRPVDERLGILRSGEVGGDGENFLPVRCWIAAAALSSRCLSRAQIATLQPSVARLSAIARPIPMLPPVTAAILPSS